MYSSCYCGLMVYIHLPLLDPVAQPSLCPMCTLNQQPNRNVVTMQFYIHVHVHVYMCTVCILYITSEILSIVVSGSALIKYKNCAKSKMAYKSIKFLEICSIESYVRTAIIQPIDSISLSLPLVSCTDGMMTLYSRTVLNRSRKE